MKKNKTQNISLKKLIIARINTDEMKKLKGGTSGLTESNFVPLDGDFINLCDPYVQ